jgi:hypothetical protein
LLILSILEEIKSKIVIIEEAAEIIEANLIGFLNDHV